MLSQGASLSKQEIWRRMKRGLRSAASTARGLAESWASAQVAQTATIITSSHITLGELDEAMATRKLFHKTYQKVNCGGWRGMCTAWLEPSDYDGTVSLRLP